MLIGRSEELQYLDNHYSLNGSQLIVVYGQKKIGKTALLKEFVEKKNFFYFCASECSKQELKNRLLRECGSRKEKIENEYIRAFQAIKRDERKKFVLVIDEFQFFIKQDETFMSSLVEFMHSQWNNGEIMIVLVSSCVGWVENTMVKKIGRSAFEISGFCKLKELSFQSILKYFPDYTEEECVLLYGVLGGVPGLWEYIDKNEAPKKNILDLFLKRTGSLKEHISFVMNSELREFPVYHTILTVMAQGAEKLNEIYELTGFSRAKISVYMKNLMELEFVEKINSFEFDDRTDFKKGIYRISNATVHFWFKFVFPNISFLELLDEESFYQSFIESELKTYLSPYFEKICRQAVPGFLLMNGLNVDAIGEWNGKYENLPIIGRTDKGELIIGVCSWDEPLMNYEVYQWLLELREEIVSEISRFYMFSRDRFDEKLNLESKIKKNVSLIRLKDLRE